MRFRRSRFVRRVDFVWGFRFRFYWNCLDLEFSKDRRLKGVFVESRGFFSGMVIDFCFCFSVCVILFGFRVF